MAEKLFHREDKRLTRSNSKLFEHYDEERRKRIDSLNEELKKEHLEPKSASSPELSSGRKVSFHETKEKITDKVKSSIEKVIDKLSPTKRSPSNPTNFISQETTQQQENPVVQPNLNFLPINYTEDYDYLNSMASHCAPPIFRGLHSEDVQAWFRHMDLWLETQRNLSEKAKISHTALLFRDAALHHYNTLDVRDPPAEAANRVEGVIYAYQDFKDNIIQRFQTNPGDNWREVAALFTCKQQPGQPTELYVAEILKRGESARATQEQMKMACLAGLRDDIRAVIMHHEIETLGDITRWAVMAEQMGGASDMSVTVKRLEEVVDRMQACAISNQNKTEDRGGVGRGRAVMTRPGVGWMRGRRSNGSRSFSQQPATTMYRGEFSRSVQNCQKCGKGNHAFAKCPAKNAICYKCRGRNHFAAVCFSRGTQRPNQYNARPVASLMQPRVAGIRRTRHLKTFNRDGLPYLSMG